MTKPPQNLSQPRLVIDNLRLGDFIAREMESILVEWEAFAATIWPDGASMDTSALRGHAADILRAIVLDLNTSQTAHQQEQKSKGHAPSLSDAAHSAAQTHAVMRAAIGFSIVQMAAEYRALRASVLKLWAAAPRHAEADTLLVIEDVGRFNEAIDQALMESVTFFTQEAERKQNLFLAVVGHDLRNPLMTIMSGAQALAKMGLEDKAVDVVARLTRGCARIKHLLNDLLDYNRAAFGSMIPIAVAESDLAEVCTLEIDGLQSAHPERVIRFYGHGDLRGVWDAARIQQLLSNLLKNALDYGAREEAIEVRAAGRDNEVVLSVHNRGPAIPPAALPHIFEPLTRGEPNSNSAQSTNMGLGMFITREIARAHGGSVSVRSDEHETIFTLFLPRKVSAVD